MKRAKRIVSGILAAFFGLAILSSLFDGHIEKGTGLLSVITIVLGCYAIFGDAAFKKPQ